MRADRRYDVLVAGAGPAGAHTALRLARAGFAVALLDRRRFPREKPCGEFMSPECLPLLGELGLRERVLAQGAARVRGMRLHGFGRAAVGRYEPIGRERAPADHGYALRREVLDGLTLAAAAETSGVDVLEEWSVGAPLRDERGRVCGLEAHDPDGAECRLGARFVVGADGARSRVARGLGWNRVDRLDRWALVARFRGVPRLPEAEVHFLEGAYFAAAPIDDGLFTANLVVDRAALRPGAGGLAALFDEHVARTPSLAMRLADAERVGPVRACGPLAVGAARVAAPGVALVGDAAGFVDPLTGEGIFFAMRGAALLADSLDELLHAPRREGRALARYVRARRREFAPRKGLARALQRGIRHPRVVERALRAFAHRPGLADLIVAWTGDYVAPRALLDPRVWRCALAAAPEGTA